MITCIKSVLGNLKFIHPTNMKLFVRIDFKVEWNILHVRSKIEISLFDMGMAPHENY